MNLREATGIVIKNVVKQKKNVTSQSAFLQRLIAPRKSQKAVKPVFTLTAITLKALFINT